MLHGRIAGMLRTYRFGVATSLQATLRQPSNASSTFVE